MLVLLFVGLFIHLDLSEQIDLCKINKVVPMSAEDGSEREEPKASCLLKGDGRRHG